MSEYPTTRRDDLVEDHFGHPVADPYRWLENAEAPETLEWVARQQAFTESALAALPERGWFSEVMGRVMARPRAGLPHERGGRFLLARNDGSQAQDVWYVADSLDELVVGGRVILDPNRWSADGTDSLAFASLSDDGRRLAYGVSHGGSDWRAIRVLDLESGGEPIAEPDVIAKFSDAEWLPDGASYLYLTYDQATHARGTDTDELGPARLMLHRVGEASDELVVAFDGDERLMPWAEVSADGRWVIIMVGRGTERRNRVWAYPLTTAQGRSVLGECVRVVDEAVAEFEFIRTVGSIALLRTDLDAPRGRVVAIDLEAPEAGVSEVVPESADTLMSVAASGDELLLVDLADAQGRLRRASLSGIGLGDVELPVGAIVALDASPRRPEAYVGVSTLDAPLQAFEVASGRVRPLELAGSVERIAPPYTVERRVAESKDGTPVPYFLVRAASVPGPDPEVAEPALDDGPVLTATAEPEPHAPDQPAPEASPGPRPTLLYGYGGFKIPLQPDYRPGWSAWLAAGGVLALANLRGGGEFGTQWYEDGRLAHKQKVFDDAIAVAEHLVETGVSSPAHLAVHGRSNGGLLAGALLTQRPDLFAAALPSVGVLDLLRFHRFTIGSAWVSDYGDPDTKEGFEAAYTYSPLHNVDPGIAYPATLVSTADHDDRVVPLHSFKFAAALQHSQASEAPVLLRVDSSAGHGAGKSTAMVAAEWADLLAFAAHHTHLIVPPEG